MYSTAEDAEPLVVTKRVPVYRADVEQEPGPLSPGVPKKKTTKHHPRDEGAATARGGNKVLYTDDAMADDDKARRTQTRARRKRQCVWACIWIGAAAILASMAIPAIVLILAHTGLVTTAVQSALPQVRLGSVSIGGLMTATAVDVQYRTPNGTWCVTASRVMVSVSPASVFRWVFGRLLQHIVIYSVSVEGLEFAVGPNCSHTYVAPSNVTVLGGSWEFDWASAVRYVSGMIPPVVRSIPGAMESLSTAAESLRSVVCGVSLDVVRLTISAADGSFELSASGVTTKDGGASAIAYLDVSRPVAFSVAAAYRTTGIGCSAHDVAIRIGAPSVGGLSASVTCSASLPSPGVACSTSISATVWGAGDPRIDASFSAVPVGSGAWVAASNATASMSTPMSGGFSWDLLAGSSRSPADNSTAVLLSLESGNGCAALLSPGGGDETLAYVWSRLSGALFAGGWSSEGDSDARLPARISLVVATADPLTPRASARGPRLSLNCSGSPSWACIAASESWALATSATARSASVSGSVPLLTLDPSGNSRVVLDVLRVWTDAGVCGCTCDSFLVDGEQPNSTAVWTQSCSGNLDDRDSATLVLECDAASIPGSVTFTSPNISAAIVPNSSNVTLCISGGQIVISGYRLDVLSPLCLIAHR